MRHTVLTLILCSVWSASALADPIGGNTALGQQAEPVTHIRINAGGVVTEAPAPAAKPQAAAESGRATIVNQPPMTPVQAQPKAVPDEPVLTPTQSAEQLRAAAQVQADRVAAAQVEQDRHSQPFKGAAMADSLYGGSGAVSQVSAPGIPAAGAVRGVEAQTLPGVGVMPGGSPELQNNVIRVSTDRTSIVNISGTLTNRIATPFEKPKAILLDGRASVKAVGQSLYVALNGDPSPVSLYVTGNGTNDPVVSLTLVPKGVPPQTIVLQMDGPASPTGPSAAEGGRTEYKDGSYSQQIITALRSLALGRVPQGYAEGMLPKSVANLGNVVAIPLARYSGPSFDVYRYRIEAVSNGQFEMEESAFWTQGVRAVSLFPSGVVSKGNPTQVFVIADKSATAGGAR